MILVIKGDYRLCQDNNWRSFANFGTYPECVKVYKSIYAARKKAKKLKGLVVKIPDGMSVDASGDVQEEVFSSTNGLDVASKTVHHKLTEFDCTLEDSDAEL